MNIGTKIKELRKEQRMSLAELAKKSGVQIATLSRMENLKMTGTIESHINIARALGVDFSEFYVDIARDENKVDVRKKTTTTDVFVVSDKSSYEILTNKVNFKKMMPILLKIEANGETNKEKNMIGSEKFIFVLAGHVELWIEENSYTLSENHSLYFNASRVHYFINKGESTAKILCVTTPPNL